jgi:predicted transcriptional regulator
MMTTLRSISDILYALKMRESSNVASLSLLGSERITKYLKILEMKGFIEPREPYCLATYSITSTGVIFSENLESLLNQNKSGSTKRKPRGIVEARQES